MKYSLCNDWEFTTQWTEALAHWQALGELGAAAPHQRYCPQHYADPADYEMVCGYRRKFRVPEGGERVFPGFLAAAHQATPVRQRQIGRGTRWRLHRLPAGRDGPSGPDRGEHPGGPAGHPRGPHHAALRLCGGLSYLRRTLSGGLAGMPGGNGTFRICSFQRRTCIRRWSAGEGTGSRVRLQISRSRTATFWPTPLPWTPA